MSVRSAFALQAEACEALGSSFTASLCRSFGSRLDRTTKVGKFCLDWEGDPGPSADSIPLRLCGGFHALVLKGDAQELASLYPPFGEVAPAWSGLEDILTDHEEFLLNWLQSPPQTNEVSRSAVVWPVLMTLVSKVQLPLRLLEVGASGGLNLNMDRFSYQLASLTCGANDSLLRLQPEWRGRAPRFEVVEVMSRAGCDIRPLDPTVKNDALKLRAYCWPDQPARQQRLSAALKIANQFPVKVQTCDAIDWLKNEFSTPCVDQCRVIYSTIAWQYLPEAARAEGEALIESYARENATTDSPLAWVRFEADGQEPGACIRMQLWPQNIDVILGRGDFHGRWIEWQGLEAN